MIVDLDRHMELLGYFHTSEAARQLHRSETAVRTRFERLQKKEGIQNNPDVIAIFCGKHPRWYVSQRWINEQFLKKEKQVKVTNKSVKDCNQSIDEAEKIIRNVIHQIEKDIQTVDQMIVAIEQMLPRFWRSRTSLAVPPQYQDNTKLISELQKLAVLEAQKKGLEQALEDISVLKNLKFQQVKPEEVEVSYGEKRGYEMKVSF